MMAARHAWSGTFSRKSAIGDGGGAPPSPRFRHDAAPGSSRTAAPVLPARCGTGIQPRAADPPPETRTPRRARSSDGA